jgi:hypothetical protein
MTMAVSPELFSAILAMDAYNRGPDRKLHVAGSQIGNASLGTSLADTNVTFFGQAYTLLNGQIIISFRGTDST